MHTEGWSDDIPVLSPSNSHGPLTTKNITHLYRVADSVSVTTQTTPESNL